MSRLSSPVVARSAGAFAGLALATAVLAGCSLIPTEVRDVVDQAREFGVENPLAVLPADWPAEVPIVDGQILVALAPAENTWSATIHVADEAAAAEAGQLLVDAGFAELIAGTGTYDSDTHAVVLQSGAVDGGGVDVVYIVTAK